VQCLEGQGASQSTAWLEGTASAPAISGIWAEAVAGMVMVGPMPTRRYFVGDSEEEAEYRVVQQPGVRRCGASQERGSSTSRAPVSVS
jgi:hypothetical protein